MALLIGGLFVLVGVTALVGDPDKAVGSRPTGLYIRALRGLREAFGDPGGGIMMIVVGLLLGSFFYWAASRRN